MEQVRETQKFVAVLFTGSKRGWYFDIYKFFYDYCTLLKSKLVSFAG